MQEKKKKSSLESEYSSKPSDWNWTSTEARRRYLLKIVNHYTKGALSNYKKVPQWVRDEISESVGLKAVKDHVLGPNENN